MTKAAQEIRLIETDKLIPYANNARTHSDEQITQIAASIKTFGFVNPIIVDKDNGLIAGNGRLAAAKKLGLKSVPCIPVEHLTEAQKRAYILADNRLAELSGWDADMLKLEIEDLKLEEFDLPAIGFDDEFLLDVAPSIEQENDTDTEEDEKAEGEVKFSEYIGESNNYVVLLFRNDIDWLAAREHFQLQSVASTRRTGEKWSTGIGRVIDGANYLTRLHDAKK